MSMLLRHMAQLRVDYPEIHQSLAFKRLSHADCNLKLRFSRKADIKGSISMHSTSIKARS